MGHKWILCIVLLCPITSYALISTTGLAPSVTVINSCTGLSATALNFGNYNPTSSIALDSSNTITVQCTLNSPFKISLNSGTTPGATISQRLMTNGAQNLLYNLYTSASRNIIWGNQTTGAQVSATGAGSAQTISIYARIPPQQVIAQGSYTDTITVTVDY